MALKIARVTALRFVVCLPSLIKYPRILTALVGVMLSRPTLAYAAKRSPERNKWHCYVLPNKLAHGLLAGFWLESCLNVPVLKLYGLDFLRLLVFVANPVCRNLHKIET